MHHRLIAINAVSLAFALIANMALLLNMTSRLSFTIAQPITIVGWYMASFLLIALVSVASTSAFRLPPASAHALSQAYYYAVIASGLYFIVSSLMILTVVGAYRGHYRKAFRLTPSQRTLMLQTISFVVYLLLGALVFSTVEGWDFLDAVYWADVTLLTVGLGDFSPSTHAGRSLLFPFAFGGIVMVGLVIGSIRSLILERGKQKMAARFLETKRQKVVSTVDDDKRTITVGRWTKTSFSEKGLTESQRREQEFRVMRQIQEKAERSRKYTALAISTTASLLLWFLGALVFWYSEQPQGWTYFMSMYFAYFSLLTIGYGDLTPISNSGKTFFVFWTLLAVPMLTILISNMGDTVIKSFKDLTMWIGSLTVLPGEQGLGSTLKVGLQRLKLGNLNTDNEGADKGLTARGAAEQTKLDRLARHVEEDELEEAEEVGEHGDYLERDIRFYHFVLAKEIRQLLKDVGTTPPKQYTYHEWSYYLRLIGQDEDDAESHRKPNVHHRRRQGSEPDLGIADEGENLKWSWLGIRSPLMGSKTEAQWLLQRLMATLEMEMMKLRSSDESLRREPPPISMSDLKNKGKGSSGSESTAPETELKGEIESAHDREKGKKDE